MPSSSIFRAQLPAFGADTEARLLQFVQRTQGSAACTVHVCTQQHCRSSHWVLTQQCPHLISNACILI